MSLRSFVIALPFLGLIYSWVPCPCTICPCAPLSLCSLVLTLLCPCVPLSSHSFVFTLLFCFALLFFASLSLRSFFLVLLFPYAPLYLRSLVLTLLCPYAPLSLRSFVLTLLCPCASFPWPHLSKDLFYAPFPWFELIHLSNNSVIYGKLSPIELNLVVPGGDFVPWSLKYLWRERKRINSLARRPR